MQAKRTLVALATAVALGIASGGAGATIVFDSGQNGPAADTGRITNGTSVFGYLTAFAAFDDFLLTQIEQKQWQGASANMKFVVFDNDTSELLFESPTFTVSPDGGAGAFDDATYKSSGPIAFTLEAGRNYMIGSLTDGLAHYWGEGAPTAGPGIATLAANRNAIGFAPPLLGSSSFCCDNYVRLTLEEVPEPTATSILGLGAASLLLARRRRAARRA